MRSLLILILSVVVALAVNSVKAEDRSPTTNPMVAIKQPTQVCQSCRPVNRAVPMFTPVYTDANGKLWTVQTYRAGLFRTYSIWMPYQGGQR